MARNISITNTSTPGAGQSITNTTYQLLADDGSTVLSNANPPYSNVSDGLLYVRQVVTQSGGLTAEVTHAIAGRVTNLAANAISSTQINLTWTDVGGETAYDIHRSTTSGFTPGSGNRIVTDKPGGSTSHNDTSGLVAGTTYYYKVIAKNSSGATTNSNQASATTTSAGSGVALVNTSEYITDALLATTPSWSHTLGTGSNRCLVVAFSVSANNLDYITDISANSTAMTLVGKETRSGITVFVYRLLNPPTGATTITVTRVSGSVSGGGVSLLYTGVNQSTPTGAVTTGLIGTSTLNINVASTVGGWVFAAGGVAGGTSEVTLGASETLDGTGGRTSTSGTKLTVSHAIATGTSTTMTRINNPTSQSHVLVGFQMNAA